MVDLAMICVWSAAGLYVAGLHWWNRRRNGRRLVEEAEAYVAGYERAKQLYAEGKSDEEVLALAKEESRRWYWAQRKRWRR